MKTLKFTLGCLLLGSLSLSAQAIEELTAASVPAVSEVASAPTAAPDPKKASLTFMDSKLFDGRLAKELESGKENVEINISGRMPLNNIPTRIDRWLITSAEEGTVETIPGSAKTHTRGLFVIAPMVFSAFGYFKKMRDDQMYEFAKQYDTKIYYWKDENGDSLIDKIVLIKRSKPAAPR